MGGSNTGGGAGGNTGADAGFFISEQRKKEKINESGYGADYQGDVNPQKKQKKKTVTTTIVVWCVCSFSCHINFFLAMCRLHLLDLLVFQVDQLIL